MSRPQTDEGRAGLEHGLVRICTVQVKHSGTRVEPHAHERGVQRMNDTNTAGDRPSRETSGGLERQTLNSGGIRPTDLTHGTRTSPGTGRVRASDEGARQ